MSSGYAIEQQRYPVGQLEAVNIIAEVPGTNRKSDIVVVGAHYDTVATTPGADDNASAVAVMLECARLLRHSRPQRTVRFVAFACEEQPHFHTDTMGSQAYAKRCQDRNERIVGMICLEMVGYYSSEQGSQAFPNQLPRWLKPIFPKTGNFLVAVANIKSWRLGWRFRRGFKRAVRFPLFSIALPEKVGIIRLSDNSSFWDHGYPAIMVTDTSYLRNPHYHEPTDTPDTLNYECMAQVALGVCGAVARIGRGTFTS
jgi:Zn-dependent M28 family amino/carboxypeptidase